MKQTSWSTSVSLFIHSSVLAAFQVSPPDPSVLKGFLFQKAFDWLWTQWNPIYQGDFCFVWSSQLSHPFAALQTAQELMGSWVSRWAPPCSIQKLHPEISANKGMWGISFPRACLSRKSRNRGHLKNTTFMWFTPYFSNRHLQCIHYPVSELFEVITKKNHPKCECPLPGWE